MPMAEPKNETLHLLLSLSLVRLLLSFPRTFCPPLLSRFLVRGAAAPSSSCSSFLSVSSPLTFALFSSGLAWSPGSELSSPLRRSSSLVSHSFTFGITWRTCMHACMHAFRSEDGSTRFRPGSRLSFSSRRREPQLVKKLLDRLGARRADSAVVYDPTPNTLSGTSPLGPRSLVHPTVYTHRIYRSTAVFLLYVRTYVRSYVAAVRPKLETRRTTRARARVLSLSLSLSLSLLHACIPATRTNRAGYSLHADEHH